MFSQTSDFSKTTKTPLIFSRERKVQKISQRHQIKQLKPPCTQEHISIKTVTFYTKGVVYPFSCRRRMAALRFPPPHTPPPLNYQPKKKYLCLSTGKNKQIHICKKPERATQ